MNSKVLMAPGSFTHTTVPGTTTSTPQTTVMGKLDMTSMRKLVTTNTSPSIEFRLFYKRRRR